MKDAQHTRFILIAPESGSGAAWFEGKVCPHRRRRVGVKIYMTKDLCRISEAGYTVKCSSGAENHDATWNKGICQACLFFFFFFKKKSSH